MSSKFNLRRLQKPLRWLIRQHFLRITEILCIFSLFFLEPLIFLFWRWQPQNCVQGWRKFEVVEREEPNLRLIFELDHSVFTECREDSSFFIYVEYLAIFYEKHWVFNRFRALDCNSLD